MCPSQGGAVQLAVVIIHYHTPDLLRQAVDTLRAVVRESPLELDLVVVDNGSTPDDQQTLAALPARLLSPDENLGYAGGINLGMGATEAESVVVMNPDVMVLPGCLEALVAALNGGAAVAGPRFFWDATRRFMLPPLEPVGRGWELLNTLADRGGFFTRRARARWRRHARRHWLAEHPLPSYSLSGALLAIRRDAWERVGRFDEGYQLYFEETDWLERARRLGLRSIYVPAAEAVHLYAQSTVREGRAAAWFLASNRRFRRRAYGIGFARLLEWLAPQAAPQAAAPQTPLAAKPAESSAPPFPAVWLEVAPSPKGYPAAGWRLPGDLDASTGVSMLPTDVWERMAPGRYWLRWLGEEIQKTQVGFLEKL